MSLPTENDASAAADAAAPSGTFRLPSTALFLGLMPVFSGLSRRSDLASILSDDHSREKESGNGTEEGRAPKIRTYIIYSGRESQARTSLSLFDNDPLWSEGELSTLIKRQFGPSGLKHLLGVLIAAEEQSAQTGSPYGGFIFDASRHLDILGYKRSNRVNGKGYHTARHLKEAREITTRHDGEDQIAARRSVRRGVGRNHRRRRTDQRADRHQRKNIPALQSAFVSGGSRRHAANPLHVHAAIAETRARKCAYAQLDADAGRASADQIPHQRRAAAGTFGALVSAHGRHRRGGIHGLRAPRPAGEFAALHGRAGLHQRARDGTLPLRLRGDRHRRRHGPAAPARAARIEIERDAASRRAARRNLARGAAGVFARHAAGRGQRAGAGGARRDGAHEFRARPALLPATARLRTGRPTAGRGRIAETGAARLENAAA